MIISCPECKGRVSSMAGTCPHCGARIYNNIKQCHECGAYCFNDATECPECHAELSVVVEEEYIPDEPAAAQQAEADSGQPGKPLHKSRSPWFISIAVCLILVCSAVFYAQKGYREEKERVAYERLEHVTNPEFFQQFLIEFPESEHVAEVTERMHLLQSEANEWRTLRQHPVRADIVRFMQTYAESPRRALCESMLDSIDWHEARQLDSAEAIEAYLQAHPSGEHAAEAAEKKNALLLKHITPQERGMVRGMLEAFFTSAMAKQDAEAVEAAIPGKMDNFCGKDSADVAYILEYAKEKKAADVIGLHYSIMEDMNIRKETLADGTIGYAVDCNLEETISRSDVRQPTKNIYRVVATASQELKLLRMSIRK